jgi:hypothetical protein
MFKNRKLEDVPAFTTDLLGFEVAFKNLNRIWFKEEGITVSRAIAQGAPFPELIFVRDDNWSIGCLERDKNVVFELWKEKWTHIIKLTH